MTEYIERDKALNICEMHYNHCISMQDWSGDTIAWNIGADIKTIPAADVIEIKHGYWKPQPFVPTKGIPTSEAVCSVCGRDVVYKIVDNKYYFEDYCPHCGTKMDGEHNEK